jgi:hypothetical protein
MDNESKYTYQIIQILADGLRVQITSVNTSAEANELVAKLPELWPGAYSIQKRDSPRQG